MTNTTAQPRRRRRRDHNFFLWAWFDEIQRFRENSKEGPKRVAVGLVLIATLAPLGAAYEAARFAIGFPTQVLEWKSRRYEAKDMKTILKGPRHPNNSRCKPVVEKGPNSNLSHLFFRLPLEIRLRIYADLVKTGCMVQTHYCPFRVRSSTWTMSYISAPYPEEWEPHQRIRSQQDDFSKDLRAYIRLGATPANWLVGPRKNGCVRYGYFRRMLCAGEYSYHGEHVLDSMYVNLALTCRAMYADVLDVFYGNNTFSFFEPETLLLFSRVADPAGQGRIKYMHLPMTIPLSTESTNRRKAFEFCCELLASPTFSSLRELDLEVLVLGQPDEVPADLMDWLSSTVSVIRGLDKFVLRVGAFPEYVRPDSVIGYEETLPPVFPLLEPMDNEFAELEAAVCGKKASKEVQW